MDKALNAGESARESQPPELAGEGNATLSGKSRVAMSNDNASVVEHARLTALRDRSVLDTPPEDRFDRIAQLAAACLDAPIALVSLVDEDRQWFKACLGVTVTEIPREWSVCDHTIRLGPNAVLVVEDAANDPRFADNPLVVGAPFIRFYAGAVLTTEDGHNLGTLCVIDTKPRPRPSDADLNFLCDLAKLVVDQLELSKARKVVDEQHRLLKNAEAISGVGHWRFDLATRCVSWSDEVFRIHGFPISDQVPGCDQIHALYHEEDGAALAGLFERAIETGVGYEVRLRIRRRDGTIRHTMARAECILDSAGKTTSIFGAFQDVTAQHLAAASLAESERHYRLLADNVSDVIAVYDADGLFRYISPSIANLLGYAPDELLGQAPQGVIHPADHDRVARELQAAATSGGEVAIEYRGLTKDGDVKWLESRPRLHRDAAGRVVEITDSVRDVSDRRYREEALQQARLDAENAARAKATFLANMSHEIRTPMNGVLGFTELLARTNLDDEQRRQIQLIADSGRAMMRLLNDILDISKIESGQLRVEAEPIDLREKLSSCVRLMEPIAQRNGVNLSINVDPALPRVVIGDQLRLRQILLNLIGNAVKFTEAGSVEVRALQRDGQLLIEVEDTGIGIASDRVSAIFQPFYQADRSTARRYGGSGLGLSISAGLASALGGSIDVRSEFGKGTVFSLSLPLAVAAAQADSGGEPGCDPADTSPAADKPVLRVLIAEDHEINQVLMATMATVVGFVPTIAANGAEALAMVQAAADGGQPYDLLLLDMQMPIFDGPEVARQLRERGFSPETLPIIAVTANVGAEDVAVCLGAGMQAHIAKPVRLRDLEVLGERFMGGRRDRSDESPADQARAAAANIANRYHQRKKAALAAIADSVSQHQLDGETIAAVMTMLHQLAGTAGYFGEAPLGALASRLNRDLKQSPPDSWHAVLKAGWDDLRQAA